MESKWPPHIPSSPDGSQIVTVSWDQTIRIWEASTRQEVSQLTGHTGPILSAAFSPDGAQIATGSADKTARIWVVSFDYLLAESERLIQRDPPLLTPDERRGFGLE